MDNTITNASELLVHVGTEQTKYWTLSDFDSKRLPSTLHVHFYLQQGALLHACVALLNQQNINLHLYLHMQGADSTANIFGLYALRNREQVVIHTQQMHQAVGATSNVVFRGLLHDQASVSVQGLIHIAHQAKRSDAAQENKNILLSTAARAVCVPSLEVLNHDVACGHGTATSQMDQNHAWYLYARGLYHDQAYKLLMRSFLWDIVLKFDDPDFCMEQIWQKMI